MIFKRFIDITVGLLLVIPISLFIFVISLIVPKAIYKQKRVGKGGKEFYCYKIRTMRLDSDKILKELLKNEPIAKEWRESRKLDNDPRITRIGRIFRKLSLDELPQIYNVLKGDMSLVGVRPITKEELERYGSTRRYYIKNRPGITGMWQVSGRNNLSFKDRVAMDRLYIKYWSLWLDIKILLITLPSVIATKGAK